MMFAIKGKHDGRPIVITWNNGVLSGDELAIEVALMQAEFSEGEGSISGYFRVGKEDILACDAATFFLLKRIFEDVELVTGDLPPLPSIPDGAIP